MQLFTHTRSINTFLATGQRDYSQWGKCRSDEYYQTEIEPLIRSIPITKQYEYNSTSRQAMQSYPCRSLQKAQVVDVLRHNREFTLLPIYDSTPSPSKFVFVPCVAMHFLSYATSVLKLLGFLESSITSIVAHDVFNPTTKQVEALIACSTRVFNALERAGGYLFLSRYPYLLSESLTQAKQEVAKLSVPTRFLGSPSHHQHNGID